MYVQAELSNGELIQSDPFDLVDSGLNPIEFDRQVQGIVDTFSDWPAMGHLGFEIGGRTRYYNPAHVVWAELVF